MNVDNYNSRFVDFLIFALIFLDMAVFTFPNRFGRRIQLKHCLVAICIPL